MIHLRFFGTWRAFVSNTFFRKSKLFHYGENSSQEKQTNDEIARQKWIWMLKFFSLFFQHWSLHIFSQKASKPLPLSVIIKKGPTNKYWAWRHISGVWQQLCKSSAVSWIKEMLWWRIWVCWHCSSPESVRSRNKSIDSALRVAELKGEETKFTKYWMIFNLKLLLLKRLAT